LKVLFAAIALISALGSSPQVGFFSTRQHDHQECEQHVYLARSARYIAVCSKGDLNASFPTQSAAAMAAQRHQKATGHQTSVRKQ